MGPFTLGLAIGAIGIASVGGAVHALSKAAGAINPPVPAPAVAAVDTGRKLTACEVELAQASPLRNRINYAAVRIHAVDIPGHRWEAYTVDHDIYYDRKFYKDNFACPYQRGNSLGHELEHVEQFERLGVQKVFEAERRARAEGHDDDTQVYKDEPGKPFRGLSIEQKSIRMDKVFVAMQAEKDAKEELRQPNRLPLGVKIDIAGSNLDVCLTRKAVDVVPQCDAELNTFVTAERDHFLLLNQQLGEGMLPTSYRFNRALVKQEICEAKKKTGVIATCDRETKAAENAEDADIAYMRNRMNRAQPHGPRRMHGR